MNPNQKSTFHIVTMGWDRNLVEGLCDRIAAHSTHSFSHIVLPKYDLASWGPRSKEDRIYFFRDDIRMQLPPPDLELLASLEQDGVPTIHNMIMGDPVVSALMYEDAMAYASFVAKRLFALYEQTRPSVVIGGFDFLHGSMGLAVAKKIGIPWYALSFSVLPPGLACFCEGMSPASRVSLGPRSKEELRTLAAGVLEDFDSGKTKAYAMIPPNLLSPGGSIRRVPSQIKTFLKTVHQSKFRKFRKFTDFPNSYSLAAMFRESIRSRGNLFRLSAQRMLKTPPAEPFVFFGLHLQPESSIDTNAHFYSNQLRIIELISRSIPPTHRLLVKLHKSAPAQYSPAELAEFARFPGVLLVSPFADTRKFIKKSALLFSIQGTIGLEAALLGKPVIMFGDSPTKIFPSVSTIGELPDLPALVRSKLAQRSPDRASILEALVSYLAPFYPASLNDWTSLPTDAQIYEYVRLFDRLENYLDQSMEAAIDKSMCAA